MNASIIPITSKDVWDAFLENKKPFTFLQTWNWGNFQQKFGNKIFRLGLYDDNRLCGVALIIKIEARRGSFLFCPHGPLFSWHKDNYFQIFFQYMQSLAKKEQVNFIRLSPLEFDADENRKLLKEYGFRPAPMHMHVELAWILDIRPSEDELLHSMRKTSRNAIKKAIKEGVEVHSSDSLVEFDAFYDIYKTTAKRHSFVAFSPKYVKTEFEAFHADKKVLFFFAKYQGKTIATAFILFSNGSAFYHHGASIRSQVNASHLLQYEAIKEGKKRGMTHYNFWGIAPDNQPRHPFAGITVFKKGFSGFSQRYVHAQDYIINSKYWLNYLIEQARKMKRGF